MALEQYIDYENPHILPKNHPFQTPLSRRGDHRIARENIIVYPITLGGDQVFGNPTKRKGSEKPAWVTGHAGEIFIEGLGRRKLGENQTIYADGLNPQHTLWNQTA